MREKDLEKIIALNQAAKDIDSESLLRRDILNDLISADGRELVGIIGARGSGKTVLLKQLLKSIDNSFYLALDSLDRDTDLFELIKYLKEQYKFSVT